MNERTIPRAPVGDGEVVAVPPLRDVAAVLAINRQRLRTHADAHTLLGRSWHDLRRQARQIADPKSDTVLVAGHQPELFHPGVWVKNFALCGLARAHDAASLNLIIDSDSVKSTALHVPVPPGASDDRPRVRSVLFDRWTGEVPYEERTIADRALFASFAERVGELLRGWHYEPMLPAFWAEVLRQAEQTSILGECFAAARRTFERDWGCDNREVAMSAVCRSEPFAWFACDLLAHLPHFHSLYNAILAEYRRRYGIRSANRPVPDLATDGDWREAPLWGWRVGSGRRGRLFARIHGARLELRAGPETWPNLPRPQNAEAAVSAWRQLEAQGCKIRSRALTTTLYARMFLADLFVHGIGGGKYDEVTDELIRRYYHCEPPEYLILSATRWLPLPRAPATPDDRRRLLRAVRDVHYNPQRHLEEMTDGKNIAELAARKRQLIEHPTNNAAERRRRFEALRQVTEALRTPLRGREEELRRQLADCERQLHADAVLQRRDYSFCLFPADLLRSFCTRYLASGVA